MPCTAREDQREMEVPWTTIKGKNPLAIFRAE
jgi:hypothetical protein